MTLVEVMTGTLMKTILVQFAEPRWTNEAIQQACALARNSAARIVLIRLMQMPHASYLGTDFGYVPADRHETLRLAEYQATAEDYGVELSITPLQCISKPDALVQAVEMLNADLLFARIPSSRIPYWRRFQVWWLRQQLGVKLITLDQPITTAQDEPLTIDTIIHPPLAGNLPPAR